MLSAMAAPDEKAPKGKQAPRSKGGPSSRDASPTASRQQKRRDERLKMIRDQVKDGTLTIRQMTPEERAQNPPRPRGSKGKKR